jgi:hypothetical protein
MTARLTFADLKPGDILLYHGTAQISWLIRLFDGGQYSHASIYDGHQTVEALDPGIVHQGVADSVKGAKYVDVYRFVDAKGRKLRDPGCPDQPVLDRINYYLQNPQRYAYEDILLLAMLASTRQIPVVSWIPGLNLLIRDLLDHAAEVLAKLTAAGKTPVICSALVYRCYHEADAGGEYNILISGADVLAAARAAEVHSALAATVGLSSAAVSGAGINDPLAAQKQDFLARYASLAGASTPSVASLAAARASGMAGAAAVAEFVTPRDLEKSRSLYMVGTLAY